VEGLNKWFEKLKVIREKFRILDQDIHNKDETEFRIGVGRQRKVIVKANTVITRYNERSAARLLVRNSEGFVVTSGLLMRIGAKICPGQVR
jgi:hypothetical protein